MEEMIDVAMRTRCALIAMANAATTPIQACAADLTENLGCKPGEKVEFSMKAPVTRLHMDGADVSVKVTYEFTVEVTGPVVGK